MISTIRAWVDREVIPNADEFEQEDKFPQAMFDQMCEFGLFGATIPEEYGGLGLDITTYTRIIEELSRGFMSLAGILNTHKIGVSMIYRYGTEEQKQRFLPRMVDGSFRASFSLSEPDAGSDTGALRCKAEQDGDEWVINGTKMWVTNGIRSSLVMLLARTPDDRITCFLVEKEPGVWYGLVWYGCFAFGLWGSIPPSRHSESWHGMVWYGVVWSGMVWDSIPPSRRVRGTRTRAPCCCC